MGGFLRDQTTLDILSQWNQRFSAGAAIDEMTALQREFQVFSPGHSLRSSYDLIGIRPHDQGERRRWYHWLDHIRTYPSDRANVNGHDRIVAAYVENFQSTTPLPVFMQCHAAKDDPRVVVTTGTPIVFSQETHLIISLPTIPAGQAPAAPGGSATP